jgi:transcriptional regulator
MYTSKHFEEPRTEVMHELMRARPLATLVTLSSGGLADTKILVCVTSALTDI